MPPSPPPAPLAIDLDGVLGDTHGLWRAWLDNAQGVLGVDGKGLDEDRGAAAAALDRAGAGNWRILLERFAEERAPVYLRPDAEVSSALRRLADRGARLGVFTDAPAELAFAALVQLGAARRVALVISGEHALERLLDQLGENAAVVRTREELTHLAA